MTDKDKFVAVVRFRDMVYFGVQPTLRECGFAPEVVKALFKEGFIELKDKKFGDDLDRYVIEGISRAGASFILQQKALRDRTKP